MQVFEEYARWMSPIGMSPRRVAKEYSYSNINFEVNDRVFSYVWSSKSRS